MTKTPMTGNFIRFKKNEIVRLEGSLLAAVADLESELAGIRTGLDSGQSTSVLNLLPKSARVHEYALRLTQLRDLIAELDVVMEEDAGE